MLWTWGLKDKWELVLPWKYSPSSQAQKVIKSITAYAFRGQHGTE